MRAPSIICRQIGVNRAGDAGDVHDVQGYAGYGGIGDHFLQRGNRAALRLVGDTAAHVHEDRHMTVRSQLETAAGSPDAGAVGT